MQHERSDPAVPTQVDSHDYHHNGNIKTKQGIGTYSYGGTCNGVTAGPHAVTQAGSYSYCYNANGDMVSGNGRTVQWSPFGKPVLMTKGSNSVAITYGPNRSRIQRQDVTAGKTVSTTYVGGYERVQTSGSSVADKLEERHYIAGVVVVTVENGNLDQPKENYMLKDHLGSIVAYVDAAKLGGSSSSALTEMAFDAWGKRRSADWVDYSTTDFFSFKSLISDRGFTGHEHLDAVGLVHMNGRVYDPVIGRFLSADPYVQAPDNLQSLNRYTYVLNNPLSYTDPSGFFFDKLWKGIKEVRSAFWGGVKEVFDFGLTGRLLREFGRFARKNKYVAEAVNIGGCFASYATGLGPIGCAAVTFAVTYAVTDGDYDAAGKAAAVAYVTGEISQGIGAGVESGAISQTQAVVAHGVVGGTASVVQGGDFVSGFISSAATKTFAFGLENNGGYKALGLGKPNDLTHIAARTAISSVVGGTVSELSGGTFANGARTAAIQHLFNFELSAKLSSQVGDLLEVGFKDGKFQGTRKGDKFDLTVNEDGKAVLKINEKDIQIISIGEQLEAVGLAKKFGKISIKANISRSGAVKFTGTVSTPRFFGFGFELGGSETFNVAGSLRCTGLACRAADAIKNRKRQLDSQLEALGG